jgi:hypothetical protein
MFARKFKGEVDPKEGLHPLNCRNPRERRMLEFLMPILNPEKPKRISLTMANTLFGTMSGVRPVNWGLLIHEVIGTGHLPHRPETLLHFPLPSSPLQALRLHHGG